ncbi:TraB/GumN family protein [Sphingomonas sanguinis]|nr:TraB/GumN family protein [Sphingomonas sanguinis]
MGGSVVGAQTRQRPPATERPATDRNVEDTSNDIVVVARRSGVPIWEVTTGNGTILMVGEINDVPKSTPWRPARLEEATRRADRVILGVSSKPSVGDVLRLILKGGKVMKLPDDRVADDYLDPRLARRLHLLEDRYDVDYSRQNFLVTARDILTQQLGFGHDVTFNATEVVRKVVKQARIPARPVDTMRFRSVIDDLLQAPPESHIRCLRAAVDAADTGPESVEERGRAWTRSDIPALSANPIEIAIGRCWPWSSDELGVELRRQWSVAIDEAARTSGTILAVIPIRVLTERGGVLDHLRQGGSDITGPSWDGQLR